MGTGLWGPNKPSTPLGLPGKALCLFGVGIGVVLVLQVTSRLQGTGRGLEAERSRAPRGHLGLSWASWISRCSLSKGRVDSDGIL